MPILMPGEPGNPHDFPVFQNPDTGRVVTGGETEAGTGQQAQQQPADEGQEAGQEGTDVTVADILADMLEFLQSNGQQGTSPNDAKIAIRRMGGNPDIVDDWVREFQRQTTAGQQMEFGVRTQTGAQSAAGGADGGGLDPFDIIGGDGTDIDLTGLAEGLLPGGFDIGDPSDLARLQQGLTRGGQRNLFSQALASQFGAQPGMFLQDLLYPAFDPISDLFNLRDVGLGLSTGGPIPFFGDFLSGLEGVPGQQEFRGAFGALQDVVPEDVLSLQFLQNPSLALSLAQNVGGGLPAFSPFAGAEQDLIRSRFNQLLGQGQDPLEAIMAFLQ